MRTIRLTEHQTSAELLDEPELAEILALGHVAVSPRGGGSFDLRPGSTVGTVALPALRVLIRPKVGLPNVFFLLTYGAGLTKWSMDSFPYEEDDFVAAIGWLLEAEIRRAARFGLVSDYRTEEDSLPTLRGRVDIAAQIRRRPGQHLPLECRFQEYDADTLVNQVLKAALRRLTGVADIDRDLRAQLRHHLQPFVAVSDAHWPASAVPELRFDRRNEIWESAGRLAQIVLRAGAVRDETGSVGASSFTVDMNALFERFVQSVFETEAQKAGWSMLRNPSRSLTASVRMNPDLVLRHGGRDYAVGDAKYKELAPDIWKHADLYQLLAYCTALGLDRGLLVYGESGRSRSEVVHGSGTMLDVVGVDLSSHPAAVLRAARAAATQFIDQARLSTARERGAA